jgi:hypothetical protein
MDEAFLSRARKLLGEGGRSQLDHPTLLSQVSEQQAATPTARLATNLSKSMQGSGGETTAALIAGAAGWRGARAAQAGCFNRTVAVRGRNIP